MNKLLLLFFMSLLLFFAIKKSKADDPPPLPVPAYVYTYDASGNRTSREYQTVYLRPGNTDTDTVAHKTSVSEHIISIFPNPTQGFLKVTITNLQKKNT